MCAAVGEGESVDRNWLTAALNRTDALGMIIYFGDKFYDKLSRLSWYSKSSNLEAMAQYCISSEALERLTALMEQITLLINYTIIEKRCEKVWSQSTTIDQRSSTFKFVIGERLSATSANAAFLMPFLPDCLHESASNSFWALGTFVCGNLVEACIAIWHAIL